MNDAAALQAVVDEEVDCAGEAPFIAWRTRSLTALAACFGTSSIPVREFYAVVRLRRGDCGPFIRRLEAVQRGKAVLAVSIDQLNSRAEAAGLIEDSSAFGTSTPAIDERRVATQNPPATINPVVGGRIMISAKAANTPPNAETAVLKARLAAQETARAKVSSQEGTSPMALNELVEAAAGDSADPRRVFVIYGRNRDARKEVFAFLRAIGLSPLEWDQAVELTNQASPYVGDVLTAGLKAAQAIIVLQTPDDIVYLDGEFCDPNDPDDPEGMPQGQPRPNVFFEAGMAMGVSPDRTVIVEFGPIKPFSDITGRHVVRLDGSIIRRQALANRLKTAGCHVDLSGPDWHSAGDLTPPKGPGKGRPLGKRLPKSERPKLPILDGRLIDLGGNKIPLIEITNHGPGDVYQLDIVDLPAEGRGELRKYGDTWPFPRLPRNKSINVLYYIGGRTHGDKVSPAMTIKVAAQTQDGQPFEQEIFISLGSKR